MKPGYNMAMQASRSYMNNPFKEKEERKAERIIILSQTRQERDKMKKGSPI
jgi:hypothetical protein